MSANTSNDELFLKYVKFGKFRVSKNGDVFNARGLPVGYITSNGYKATAIRLDDKTHGMLIHRLVYLVHKGPIAKNLVINHKDGNKLNNNIRNLEAVTYSRNSLHAHATGLMRPSRGVKHPSAKLSSDDVLSIRKLFKTGVNKAELGRRFNISAMCIRLIVTGKSYKDVVEETKNSTTDKPAKKTPEHVLLKIMKSLRSTKQLAVQYGLRRKFVLAVRKGIKYKKLRALHRLPIIPAWIYRRSPDGLYGDQIKRILCAGSPKFVAKQMKLPLDLVLKVRCHQQYEQYHNYFGHPIRKMVSTNC